VKRFQRIVVVIVVALLASAAPALEAAPIRVTTWNLEWFPNGTPKELPRAEQDVRIAAAADVLRPLNPDIILLQEIKDLDACTRLAEAIRPNTYRVAICSAFREGNSPGIGKQQVAVLAKEQAQAAWAESWKSMNGVDPPRGFAFASFKIGGVDVGVYSLHLKSNLVMHGDKTAEAQKNRLKREVSIEQVLNHIRNDIPRKLPTVKSFVVGGDFNTNLDQPEFAGEKTITKLTDGGFRSAMEGTPLFERITHPGSGPYPDATFDYLFGYNLAPGKVQIIESDASDHLPVTCDFTLGGNYAQSTPAPTANATATPRPTEQFVTLTQPVKIKILYGETVLPRGLKLPVLSRNAQTVTVKYLDETPAIPISATDLH
jgi:endonuclease/exonuclease/phosphatase family metal-dependent hydrolase